MSLNKVMLLGYVGRDPELRYPEKDHAIAYFPLATTEFNSSSNTERTEWHNIVMTGENAYTAEKYIRKGTRLFLEGKLHTREYIDRMKITRKRTEIIVSSFEIVGRMA